MLIESILIALSILMLLMILASSDLPVHQVDDPPVFIKGP